MDIFGSATITKWANRRLGENPGAYSRWLLPYVLMLALGILGDITWCKLMPSPVLWAQILPELHYIGIIFLGTRFGDIWGVGSARVARVLHVTVVALACPQPD